MASKRTAPPDSPFSTPKRVPTPQGWRSPTAQTAAEKAAEMLQLKISAPLCCGVRKACLETGAHNTKGNAGRRFYQCQLCNDSFEWIDRPPRSARHTPQRTFEFDPSTSLHERLLNASREGNLAGVQSCLAAPQEQVMAAVNLSGKARSGTAPATPLRFAAFHGFGAIVRALLDAGALVSLLNEKGQSALDLAEIGGAHEGAKGLRDDRPRVLQMLRQAKSAERFEICGVTRPAQLHLIGLRVEVIDVRADGKYVVRVPGHENQYSLPPEKLRRPTEDCPLASGSRAVLCGLGQEGYNGAAVEVLEYAADRQRYQIQFLADGRDYKEGACISVKPKNLKPL
jgi:hypothetical protein